VLAIVTVVPSWGVNNMPNAKSKDNNSKTVIESREGSEDDYGLFEVFRANSIPGHNKSIQMLASVLDNENHTISELKPQYSNGPGVNIFTHGSSGTEYKIEVFSNPIILNAFDKKMAGFDNDDSKTITILSTFCPLVIDFKLYAYNPADSSWNSICVDAVKVADYGENGLMPHRLDAVVSLLLILADDLINAKLGPMNTIRRSLLRNWKSVWLLNKNTNIDSIDDFVRIGTELFNIEKGD
jgi:hypothetical protein